MVDLETDVLDLIMLECKQVLLSCHEKRKRDVEEDLLDVGLDHEAGLLELHALGQELDGQGESPGSHKL